MHLKITKVRANGRVLEYAKIVHTFREGRKIRQKVLKNLGPIRSPEDKRRFEQILEAMRREEKVVTTRIGDIRLLNSMDFGVAYAVERLWDMYGISRVIEKAFAGGKFKFDAAKIVRLLVTHRLHDPSSDLSAYEWIREEVFTDLRDIQKQHVYRTLDQLIRRKKKIEVGVFRELQRTLGLKADIVFYDLTSTYFEGEGPELAEYGKSRDHRPDRKQLVLALALIDGIPVFHEVFPGNTADRATLKHAVERLKKHFDIERIIFVADRGLFSAENLDFLDEKGYEYIVAMKRRMDKKIKRLILTPTKSRKRIFAREVGREGNRRYILCVNRDVERDEREHLRRLRRSLEWKLKKLADSCRRDRGRGPSRESLIRKAFKLLGKHRKLFNLEFEHGLWFTLNREVWEYENKIAGRFLLVTTSNLLAERVMKSYKELRSVENAFKEIKHFVDIRPIYHSEDRRVKAHVFVCVLAYLTEALIGKLVPYQNARKTVRALRRIKATEVMVGGERVLLIRKARASDVKIFNSLGIEPPVGQM